MQYEHFGRYLYSLRIRRGYENISDFLQDHTLPISGNYYRDVEAGRKLPGFEKANELFEALPYKDDDDRYEFFWHYLKEVLPEEVHDKVLTPRVDTSFRNVKNAQELLEYDLRMHRDAAAIARFEQTHVSTDDQVSLLEKHYELMPLLHFIYMVSNATEDDIDDVCSKNSITNNKEEIDEFLTGIGVEISTNINKRTYRRSKHIFRIPRTERGIQFKGTFIKRELDTSFGKARTPEMFSEDETFEFSSIVALSERSREKLTGRLRDLISELSVSGEQLDEPTSTPFFVNVVVSGRPEYRSGTIKIENK